MVHISSLIEDRLDRLDFHGAPMRLAYHLPCHLKAQPDPGVSLRLLSAIPGIGLTDLESHCCGMAGSWGMTAAHFDLSRRIGADLMGRLADSGAQTGVTDCPTCRMQMEQFGPTPIRHPVEIVAQCLR